MMLGPAVRIMANKLHINAVEELTHHTAKYRHEQNVYNIPRVGGQNSLICLLSVMFPSSICQNSYYQLIPPIYLAISEASSF